MEEEKEMQRRLKIRKYQEVINVRESFQEVEKITVKKKAL